MTDLEHITQLYSEYVQKAYKDRVHAGDLLWNAGNLLLKIEKKLLNSDETSDYYYMLSKIATDLLRQVDTMANTKVYDSATMLEDYYRMAYNLTYLCCEKKADRRLLPFISHVMYYENFNEDKTELNKIKEIFTHSLLLEQKFIDKLINSDQPGYFSRMSGL